MSKLDENSESANLEANHQEISLPPKPLVSNTSTHNYEQNELLTTNFSRSKSTPRAGFVSSSEDDDPFGKQGTEIRRHRMQKLISTVDELNKAMESLVVSVVVDSDNAKNGFSSVDDEKKKDILNDNQNLNQQQLTAN